MDRKLSPSLCRTPLRVSLLGGGSDLKKYWSNKPGRVLSAAINLNIDVYLRPRMDGKFRIATSKIDHSDHIEGIENDIIREALLLRGVDFGLDICVFSDVTSSGSGLGASSALTVGLLKAIDSCRGQRRSNRELIGDAFEVEAVRCQRTIGLQDFFPATLGGYNLVDFRTDGSFDYRSPEILPERLAELESTFVLLDTGIRRDAGDVLSRKTNGSSHSNFVSAVDTLVELIEPLNSELSKGNWSGVFDIFERAWELKVSTGVARSTPELLEIYDAAKRIGAKSGKVLGAGGGAYVVFRPEAQTKSVLFCFQIAEP